MVNIINQAPAAAFAPAFVMSAAATSVALVADRGREHTRGFAAVAAKRTQGTPVWSPPTS
ncbi:hypothetical protein [Nocardioides alcanivorans]|uniref:hypothetical protein n=1 Tax=Nocardioides alcanivorans TaxID=2897352 RepID=UPI001F48A7CE|nr:hypothetical protein [Nocardioides alcanivorans]